MLKRYLVQYESSMTVGVTPLHSKQATNLNSKTCSK
jgi:hypothetical protein